MTLGVLAMLIAGCEQKNEFKPPPPPKVTVAKPVEQAVTQYLDFTGNSQAIYTVQLRARVEGYLIAQHFQDGADVRKGDLLFTIQPEQYQAQLQNAEADVLNNKAALDHAETEFQRYSRLYEQKAAAATDVDNWRYQRDSAKAAIMAAEAQVELAKLNLGYTKVTAPFTGRMGRRLQDPGNVVGVGEETVLAEINQIDPMYVYFTISEQDLLRVRKLQQEAGGADYRVRPVPVYAGLANETGNPHEGRIDFAAISVDTGTGTLLLRAVFPNPDRNILPGLFVRLRVPVGREAKAILVPEVALGFDQIGRYVLLVNDKNVIERRSVTVGAPFGEMRVIDDGLKGDERVVVNGLLRAIPGREVTPESQAPRPAAGSPGAPAADGQKASALSPSDGPTPAPAGREPSKLASVQPAPAGDDAQPASTASAGGAAAPAAAASAPSPGTSPGTCWQGRDGGASLSRRLAGSRQWPGDDADAACRCPADAATEADAGRKPERQRAGPARSKRFVEVLHRTSDLRQRHRHHHDDPGRGVHLHPADRPVSGDHAADHPGDDQLSGRQRRNRRQDHRRADRAGGQRRRGRHVHVLDQHQRRQLHADHQLQGRQQPEHGAVAGAELRQHRTLPVAGRRQLRRASPSGRSAPTSCWWSTSTPTTTDTTRRSSPTTPSSTCSTRWPGCPAWARSTSSVPANTACGYGSTRTSCSTTA